MGQGNPPNYNMIALGAMMGDPGSRLMHALATQELIRSRQAEELRKQELERQLGFVHEAEAEDDPFLGLERLSKPQTGWRPESYKAIGEARKGLTGRAAARAAARATTEDTPGHELVVPNVGLVEPEPGTTTQRLPYSPDRSLRGPQRPPPQRFMPASQDREDRRGRQNEFIENQEGIAAQMARAMDLPGAPPSRGATMDRGEPTPLTEDKSGQDFEVNVPVPGQIQDKVGIHVPPTYRYPKTEEELREAMSPRERELFYEATSFKGLPPDTRAVELSLSARAPVPESPQEIQDMVSKLQEQFDQLPPEMQAAMAGRLRNVKSFGVMAQRDRKALNKFMNSFSEYESAYEKITHQNRTMAFRREQFEQKKEEFTATLTRMDQAIKMQQWDRLDREVDNARSTIATLERTIETMMADPVEAKVVGPLQQQLNIMRGRLQHLMQLSQERRNEPLPAPPTGRGPASAGNPGAHAPVGRGEAAPPTKAAPPRTATPPTKPDPLGIR